MGRPHAPLQHGLGIKSFKSSQVKSPLFSIPGDLPPNLDLPCKPLSQPLCGPCQQEGRGERKESFLLPLTRGHRPARSDDFPFKGSVPSTFLLQSQSVIW